MRLVDELEQVEQVLLARLKWGRGEQDEVVCQVAEPFTDPIRQPASGPKVVGLVDDHHVVADRSLIHCLLDAPTSNRLQSGDALDGLETVRLVVKGEVVEEVSAIQDRE